VYKGTPSITLSCSARTNVLSCSVGTDGAEKDSLSFANKLLQFAASAFSCFVVSILLKTPTFVNDWYLFQIFYPFGDHPTVLRDDELEPKAVSA